jgi:hypothetical protein
VLTLWTRDRRILEALNDSGLSRVRTEIVRLFDPYLVTAGVAARGSDGGHSVVTLAEVTHRNVGATQHQRNRDSERRSHAAAEYLMHHTPVRQHRVLCASVHA